MGSTLEFTDAFKETLSYFCYSRMSLLKNALNNTITKVQPINSLADGIWLNENSKTMRTEELKAKSSYLNKILIIHL